MYRAVIQQTQTATARSSKNFQHPTRLLVFVVAIVVLPIVGCGKPNPVDDSQDPTYIPFADTSFLIPRKIWLKGYGRSSVDNKVVSISLHALAPNVEPWSPEVNDRMYPRLGRKDRIDIYVRVPNTAIPITEKDILRWGRKGFKLKEESLFSDPAIKFYEGSGLKRHRDIYTYIQEEKIKYRIACGKPSKTFPYKVSYHCNIQFRYKNKYPVTITFSNKFLPQWLTIAKETESLLELLEATGKTYEKFQTGENKWP